MDILTTYFTEDKKLKIVDKTNDMKNIDNYNKIVDSSDKKTDFVIIIKRTNDNNKVFDKIATNEYDLIIIYNKLPLYLYVDLENSFSDKKFIERHIKKQFALIDKVFFNRNIKCHICVKQLDNNEFKVCVSCKKIFICYSCYKDYSHKYTRKNEYMKSVVNCFDCSGFFYAY